MASGPLVMNRVRQRPARSVQIPDRMSQFPSLGPFDPRIVTRDIGSRKVETFVKVVIIEKTLLDFLASHSGPQNPSTLWRNRPADADLW